MPCLLQNSPCGWGEEVWIQLSIRARVSSPPGGHSIVYLIEEQKLGAVLLIGEFEFGLEGQACSNIFLSYIR